MGHTTASFTLDVYATALDDMKRNYASRMQSFIDDVITGSKPGKRKNKGKFRPPLSLPTFRSQKQTLSYKNHR